MPTRILARHHAFEFYGCDARRLDAVLGVRRALDRLCRAAGLHVVRRSHHRFRPQGLTTLYILRESHLAYSSWPEHGYAFLDLDLCGPARRLGAAVRAFARFLGARRLRRRLWSRWAR